MKRFISNIYDSLVRLKRRFQLEYTLQNFVVRIRYRKAFLALKDIHKGERCFIIGNGPSLTAADLTLIKDEYCFAANRIFYIYDKTEWRPTYYCAQDTVVIEDILEELNRVETQSEKMFLISDCYNKVSKELLENKDVLFFCAKYRIAHKNVEFSDSIEKHIYGGGSITYAAIQIAAYMGFSKIYLIGVDHSYASASFSNNEINNQDVMSSYFEGMPSHIKMNRPNTDKTTYSFIKAKEYCESHGIEIFNSTRGGKLDVFQRIPLEAVLGQ